MRIAAYARYSSDAQREASLEDQLRNCRAYCTRMGWPAPAEYQDAAISGSRNDRPGYLRLLADATRVDVILVDDLSRLSRDSIESATAIRRLKFAGVRVVGVSDGYDTAQKGHKANGALRGLMSELYLDDLAEKTHRGLTGRALAGASAGGLPFGYAVGVKAGQRIVEELQADVVRRIFSEYLAGGTPRSIAAGLNRDGVPSARLGKSWAASAIHGDVKRGIGILANPIYIGRQVWNRSHWIKHPDTGRRIRQERPREDWIEQILPELAIVDRATWDAVQARIKRQGACTGKRGGPGRPPKYLLSGLLRCAECGGPLVMVDAKAYACSVAKERGTCGSRLRLPRREAEANLLAGVQQQLLSDEAFAAFRKAYAAAAKARKPDSDAAAQRLATAERERGNLMAALRAGIITPTTKAELLSCEAAVANAQAELEHARATTPARLVPQLKERWEGIVAALAQRGRNMPAARDALRELIGEAIVRNENGAILLEITPCPINVVAGAGFVGYLPGPVRIQLVGS
jgi:DNA invertase Pin-like site-specific DNA recombinase